MPYYCRINIKVLEAFITVFFIGYIKVAPGTFGSLAGVILTIAIYLKAGPYLFFVIILLLALLGIIAIHHSTKKIKNKDRKEIVIDEVVGQSISLFPISVMASKHGLDLNDLWPFIFFGFLSFRFFDIFKFGPVKRADNRNDAIGVMLDDVYAGIVSALLLMVLMVVIYGY